MKKIMISVAPVAASTTHINPKAIADDVIQCYKSGAAMVHLHVRYRNGALTSDMTLVEETIRYIKEACDIIIEVSTGGVSKLNIDQRCRPCYSRNVEAVSLNVGSVNLGESVYQNPIRDVKQCVQKILENSKFPEIEVFELGMIHTVKQLDEQFGFVKPLLFALVFGHEGEMPATKSALHHMVNYLREYYPDEKQALWGYTQAYRQDYTMMEYALSMGASSIRIGFEDSDYLETGQKAKTNAPLITKAADMIRSMGMEPMSTAEARKLMNLSS